MVEDWQGKCSCLPTTSLSTSNTISTYGVTQHMAGIDINSTPQKDFSPSIIGGMQLTWTGVGSLNPIAAIWATNHSLRPKLAKLDIFIDRNFIQFYFIPRGLRVFRVNRIFYTHARIDKTSPASLPEQVCTVCVVFTLSQTSTFLSQKMTGKSATKNSPLTKSTQISIVESNNRQHWPHYQSLRWNIDIEVAFYHE